MNGRKTKRGWFLATAVLIGAGACLTQANAARADSEYFGPGPDTYFTVPDGVTSISIVGGGGGGGGGCNCYGCGAGGDAVAYTWNYAVTPGETLDVVMQYGGNQGCATDCVGGGAGGSAFVTGPGVDMVNYGGDGGSASCGSGSCTVCGASGGAAAVTIYW